MANTKRTRSSKKEVNIIPNTKKLNNAKKIAVKDKSMDSSAVEHKSLGKKSLERLEEMYKKATKLNGEVNKPFELFTDPELTDLKLNSVIYKINDIEMITLPEFPEIKMKITKSGRHPYMCKKCLKGFQTKKAFEAHVPRHIFKKTEKRKPPVKKFLCEYCSKEFVKGFQLKRHTLSHTREKTVKCNICNTALTHAYNLSKHMLQHLNIKPFVCEICDKQFGTKDVLKRHVLTHSAEKPYKCAICEKGFIRPGQLQHHLKMKHPQKITNEITEIKADVTETVKKESNIKDKKVKRKITFKQHLLRRSSKKHVKKKHPEKKITKSNMKDLNNIKEHLLTPFHIKPFVCEICNERFERNALLKQHVLLHSAQNPAICPVCKKMYVRKSFLENHLKAHHPNECNELKKSKDIQNGLEKTEEIQIEECIEDFFKENIGFN